jgi:hypothetical protein
VHLRPPNETWQSPTLARSRTAKTVRLRAATLAETVAGRWSKVGGCCSASSCGGGTRPRSRAFPVSTVIATSRNHLCNADNGATAAWLQSASGNTSNQARVKSRCGDRVIHRSSAYIRRVEYMEAINPGTVLIFDHESLEIYLPQGHSLCTACGRAGCRDLGLA